MDEQEYTPADAIGDSVERNFESGAEPKQVPPPAQLPEPSPDVWTAPQVRPAAVQPEAVPEAMSPKDAYRPAEVSADSVQQAKQELIDSAFPPRDDGSAQPTDNAPVVDALQLLVEEIKGLRRDMADKPASNPLKHDKDGNVLLVDTNPPQNLPTPQPKQAPVAAPQQDPPKQRSRYGKHAYASRRPSKRRKLQQEQETQFIRETLSRQNLSAAQPTQQTPPQTQPQAPQQQGGRNSDNPTESVQKAVDGLQKLLTANQQQLTQVLGVAQQMSQMIDGAINQMKQNEVSIARLTEFVQGTRNRAMGNGRRS